jgi:hypothetical protein
MLDSLSRIEDADKIKILASCHVGRKPHKVREGWKGKLVARSHLIL